MKKMERGKISSLQMAILMYPTIIATGIIFVPGFTAKYAQQDLWIPPIMASLIGYVTVYIAYKLHNFYPNETVIQFSERIIGWFPGKILGFLFLYFYISTTGYIIRDYSEFLVSSFLTKTPISVVMASMTLLCAFVVQAGLEVLGRVGQLFFPLFVVPLMLLILLLLPEFEIENILPLFDAGVMPLIKGAFTMNGWFSEFFMIIFLLPFLVDKNKGRRRGFQTILAVTMTIVVVNLTVLFVLGSTSASQAYPLITAGRYISLADFFENLESMAMAVWVAGAFIKISVFYYVSAIGTAQWLNLSDYQPVIWPLGILLIEFGFWSLPSSMEVSRNAVPFLFYAPLLQTFVPLILLLIAVIRKKTPKEKINLKEGRG